LLIILATEKAGLYFVHISALTIACRRLWIGTGNGIIISVPLTDSKQAYVMLIKHAFLFQMQQQQHPVQLLQNLVPSSVYTIRHHHHPIISHTVA
jgi:hypothetical protein